jgi:hypothetical protein
MKTVHGVERGGTTRRTDARKAELALLFNDVMLSPSSHGRRSGHQSMAEADRREQGNVIRPQAVQAACGRPAVASASD